MGELVIQYHDFENAKKEIKKFSEQTTTDLDLRRVDDSKGVGEFLGDWFFGRGIGKDHLVKGEELNDLTSQIQTHLHSINNTQIKLIKEFVLPIIRKEKLPMSEELEKPKIPRWYRAFIYQRIYQYCREKHEKIREDLRRYPGNTETGKCRNNLQCWAFEKKYKAKTEL